MTPADQPGTQRDAAATVGAEPGAFEAATGTTPASLVYVNDIDENNVDADSTVYADIPAEQQITLPVTLRSKSQQYKVTVVVLRLDAIDFTERTPREIVEAKVGEFISKILHFGYISTNGVIQVTPNPLKPGRFILIDGAHRKTALVRIKDSGEKDVYGRDPAEAVVMAVKERIDGVPMTEVEILFEAGGANAGALTPLPMSSAHQLQWATHVMMAIAQTEKLVLAPGIVNVETTAEQLMQSGNVPSSQKGVPVRLPTLKRSITIGIMLSVSPRTQTRLMRYLSMLEADRMMVSTIKKKRSRPPAQSGRSSISCEGLVSPAFIFCPGTPREDADIVRDKLLEIGWLWTGVNTGKKSRNRLKKGHDSMFFTAVLVLVNRLRVAVRVAKRQLEGASEEQVVAALAARKQHVKDVIARKVLLDGGCRTREGEATAAHHRRRRMRVDARNARRQKTIAKL